MRDLDIARWKGAASGQEEAVIFDPSLTMRCRQIAVVASLLLSAARISAASPELWVEALDDKIPRRTPAGQIANSIDFVLNIRGGDDTVHFLNLYYALHFRVRDSRRNIIPEGYSRDQKVPAGDKDIVHLVPKHVQKRTFTLFFDSDTLKIPDLTGGVFTYRGISQGTIYLDVTFDTTRHSVIHEMEEFERKWMGDSDPFFRGAIHCGTLTLHIGKGKPVPHKKVAR